MTKASTVRRGGGGWFQDGADRGRVLISGADTEGRWSLMEWVVATNPTPAGHGAHLHRACEESFLIRQGTLEFLLGDEVTTLSAGDFIAVPPGARHGYANVSGAPVEMLVGFHPAGLEALFVKYRADGGAPADGESFVAEATRLHASEFETDESPRSTASGSRSSAERIMTTRPWPTAKNQTTNGTNPKNSPEFTQAAPPFAQRSLPCS